MKVGKFFYGTPEVLSIGVTVRGRNVGYVHVAKMNKRKLGERATCGYASCNNKKKQVFHSFEVCFYGIRVAFFLTRWKLPATECTTGEKALGYKVNIFINSSLKTGFFLEVYF
jgi:hypothetical protein